jgi:hypothetical protein
VGRAGAVVALSLSLLGVVAVAVLSSVGGASAARHRVVRRPPVPPGLNSPRVQANIRGFRRRQARLRSAAGKRRRARSRRRFRAVAASDALAIDRGHFQSVFASPAFRGLDLRPGERVHEYTSDYSALIDHPGGKRGLAESTLPLVTKGPNGSKVPVDLSLRDGGAAFEPTAPLVPATLSKAAREGFGLPGAGITVRPADAADGGASVTDDKVFYANVLTDTDMLIRPTPTGVESYSVLRSAASPEAITFSLSLPEGAQLRLLRGPDGVPAGAAVARDGTDVLEIPPPVAYDSDGQRVPVAYSVAGAELTVNVPHRGAGYRYPMLVDPDFKVTEQFYNHTGWQSVVVGGPYATGTGSFLYQSPVPNYGWRSGLIVQANTGTYQLNSYANLYYTPPANSYIYSGVFQHVTYGWLYQAVNEGLWLPNGQPEVSRQIGTNMDNNDWNACPDSLCSPFSGTDNNVFVLGLQNIYLSNTYYNTASAVTMQSAVIYERDRYNPQVTGLSQNAPSGWVDSVALSATATGGDTGLGMKEFAWVQPDLTQITSTNTCSGAYGNRCPSSWSATFNYNTSTLNEGVNTFGVAARDVVNNGSPETHWQVKVDHTPPSISLSGQLWDDRTLDNGDGTSDAGYITSDESFQVDAADGSAASPRSGVASLEMLIDGRRVHPEDYYAQGCSASGCPYTASRSFTFHVAEFGAGDHQVTVIARDQLASPTSVTPGAHTATQVFTVHVGADPQVADAPSPDQPTPDEPGYVQPGLDTSSPYLDDLTTQQKEVAQTRVQADALNPLADLNHLLGLSQYTVVEVDPVAGDPDPVTGKLPNLGARVLITLSNPHAVDTTVPSYRPPWPGSSNIVQYRAHMVSPVVSDLAVEVDLATNQVIDIEPYPSSNATTYDPVPGTGPLPSDPPED